MKRQCFLVLATPLFVNLKLEEVTYPSFVTETTMGNVEASQQCPDCVQALQTQELSHIGVLTFPWRHSVRVRAGCKSDLNSVPSLGRSVGMAAPPMCGKSETRQPLAADVTSLPRAVQSRGTREHSCLCISTRVWASQKGKKVINIFL
jgi:hypothetical protein